MDRLGARRETYLCQESGVNILGHVDVRHKAFGGSILALRELLDELEIRGHKVELVQGDGRIEQKYQWADIIIVQRAAGKTLRRLAPKKIKACYIHNSGGALRYYNQFDLVIFNSENVQRQRHYTGKQLVAYPLHRLDRYKTTPGDGILLVNCSEEKGAALFYQLATRMPDRKFIACEGRTEPFKPHLAPKNVQFLPATNDMKSVYSLARIVVIPSRRGRTGWKESWGRVAIEAAVSGIPVIASENEGLRESLGWAGIFCHPDNVSEWEAVIKKLDNSDYYQKQSDKVQKRAGEVAEITKQQVDNLDRIVRNMPRVEPQSRWDRRRQVNWR